jgi:hypothetical protein
VVGARDAAVTRPFGHLRTEIPAKEAGSPARTAISAGRDVELGARSMLLLAEGLFRLDVVAHEDTVQTLVRSLAAEPRAELRSEGEVGGESLDSAGEAGSRSTTRFGGEIVLIGEEGTERTVARVLVGSVCHLERGITTFTAQATLL